MTQLHTAPVAVPLPGIVLVVDDTEENRYATARWLERAGHRVTLASTGAEALRLATENVDLVVLDVHLPDLHGFDVARRLRADPNTAHLPVIHLSAKLVTLEDRISGLASGASAYLAQPVSCDELIATVDALLRLSRVERQMRSRNAELEMARLAATRAKERAEEVLALSLSLTEASTPQEVAESVIRRVTAMFDASGTVIVRRDPVSDLLELLSGAYLPTHVQSKWRRFPDDAGIPIADVMRRGESIFLESHDDWRARYPAILPLLEVTGTHANAIAPLILGGKVIGALGVAFTQPKTFTGEDRALLRSTAQHAALALERSRLLEAERARRDEAEQANQFRSELLSVMSHELRTPLNAIAGYAELMALGLQGPVTPTQVMALTRIQRSHRNLLGLLNGLLAYAGAEGAHVQYDIQDVALGEVLTTCESLIEPQARAKRVALSMGACDSRLRARGDAEKVQQIVISLLAHGVHRTEPDGRVEASCGAGRCAKEVEVRVTDTGPGIDASQLDGVFQPFTHLDAGLSRTREGAALGLAISRDLARGMGGDLRVDSVPGSGSTFTLTLPASLEPAHD